MVLNKTIEINEIPKGMLVSIKEANKDKKVNINLNTNMNYLGYIDIYNNFNEVTYNGKRAKVED